MRVKFIDVEGVRTRYFVSGEGAPLILLHGVGLSADTFFLNMDAIGTCRTVYAVDMLGHGFTETVLYEGGAPHAFLVEHVIAFADALGLKQFAIGGSSFGAQIAALVYFSVTERISKLVVIGSGSSFNSEEEQMATLGNVYKNAITAMNDPTWESCVKRIENICYDASTVRPEIILLQLTSYARPEIKSAYEATLRGMTDPEMARRYRILERLPEIDVPTLLIWGRQDTRGKWQRAEQAATMIKDARLVIFEECGHLPYMEKPDEFNKAMISFLSEHG